MSNYRKPTEGYESVNAYVEAQGINIATYYYWHTRMPDATPQEVIAHIKSDRRNMPNAKQIGRFRSTSECASHYGIPYQTVNGWRRKWPHITDPDELIEKGRNFKRTSKMYRESRLKGLKGQTAKNNAEAMGLTSKRKAAGFYVFTMPKTTDRSTNY